MPTPASGTISLLNVNQEIGNGTNSISLDWVRGNTKDGQNSLGGIRSRAWYARNVDGNCNGNNCNCGACNCGNIQCYQCFIGANVACANCDTRAWLQVNCNCACTYNCIFNVYSVNCNCACACDCGSSCFLEGALVAMADGTFKPIEEVRIGDYVLGGYGEHNQVIALDRPLLGNRPMGFINGHGTTLGHPHFRTDRTFGVIGLSEYLNNEQGSVQPVIVEDGSIEYWALPGLPDELISSLTELQIGDVLHHIDGVKPIETIEEKPLPSDTQLYNLVISGSHTYFVDGYLVSGFFNAQDFDYEKWAPKGVPYTRKDYFRAHERPNRKKR